MDFLQDNICTILHSSASFQHCSYINSFPKRENYQLHCVTKLVLSTYYNLWNVHAQNLLLNNTTNVPCYPSEQITMFSKFMNLSLEIIQFRLKYFYTKNVSIYSSEKCININIFSARLTYLLNLGFFIN